MIPGMRRVLLVGVIASLALPLARAQSSDETDELARLLVLRSGMAVQIHAIPLQFEQSAAQHRGRVPAHVIALVTQAGKEAFQPAKLHEEVVRNVAGKMSPAAMREALGWLESDVGRRVTAAEEDAATSASEASTTTMVVFPAWALFSVLLLSRRRRSTFESVFSSTFSW